MKFKNRLFLLFLLFSLIPMSIVGIVIYTASYHSILDSTITLTQEIMHRTTDEIDSTIILTERIAEMLQYEPDLQAAMREPITPDDHKERIGTLQINTLLNLIQSYIKTNIYGIYCIGENGRQFKSNTLSMPYTSPQEFDWYQKIIQENTTVWFPPHNASLIATTGNIDFITYGIPFVDKLTGKQNGVVLVELRASIFDDTIKNIGILEVNDYFILDENKSIISSSSPNVEKIPDVLESSTLKYEKRLSNGWIMMSTISQKNIARNALATLKGLIMVIAPITILCCLMTSLYMSKQVSDPINQLMRLMQKVESGNFLVSMPEKNNNYEIRNLSRSFNVMAKKCSEFLQQIKMDQISLRKAHFAALQAQINPHFLYNSLDTVAWNIRLHNNEEAITILMSLTKFFRRSLSKGEEIVKVGSELEHVTLYLQVQQLRYKDTMQFEIDADENLLGCITPKLILQPIAENALYHGIKNKDALGTISIRLFEDSGNLIFTVTDNGIGIPEEQVQNINNSLQLRLPFTDKNSENGYGIQNVNERIKIYFGEDYGLFYESEYLKYTTVYIILPMLDSEQQLDEISRERNEHDKDINC